MAEQQLALPPRWLASVAAGLSDAADVQENGHANGAGAAAQPALQIAHEGPLVVISGPGLRVQACTLRVHLGRYPTLLSVILGKPGAAVRCDQISLMCVSAPKLVHAA